MNDNRAIPIREPADNTTVGRLKLACELIASLQTEPPDEAAKRLQLAVATAKAALGEEKEVGR